MRTRNPIERYFGIWKRRFPILVFGIRIKLNEVEAVVIGCAVLHNIACILKEELPPLNVEEEAVIGLANNINIQRIQHLAGVNINSITQEQLIREYFSTLT